MPFNRILTTTLICVGLLAGCAAPQSEGGFNDPYEQTNRKIHNFNRGLDRNALRPAGETAAQLPMEIREPVANFADNVALPGMVLNGLLQADIGGAATNTMRLLINTTAGIGGLFDPAGAIGLTEESTDFGETLHVWGIPEGAFVELPLLGPSTERDAVGRVVDFVIDPVSRYGHDNLRTAGTVANVGDLVISRGEFGDTIDSILYDSADSYAQSRLIYLQNRRFELGDTSSNTQVDPYNDPTQIDPFMDLDLFE